MLDKAWELEYNKMLQRNEECTRRLWEGTDCVQGMSIIGMGK